MKYPLMIDSIQKNSTILEINFDNNNLLEKLIDRNCSTYAIRNSAKLFHEAKNIAISAELIDDYIVKLDAISDTGIIFDYVIFESAFEMIKNKSEVLAVCKKLLRDNGYLIINTLNSDIEIPADFMSYSEIETVLKDSNFYITQVLEISKNYSNFRPSVFKLNGVRLSLLCMSADLSRNGVIEILINESYKELKSMVYEGYVKEKKWEKRYSTILESLEGLKKSNLILERKCDNFSNEIIEYQKVVDSIYKSTSWRITKPLRFVVRGLKKIFKRGPVYKVLLSVKYEGVSNTWQKIKTKLKNSEKIKANISSYYLSKDERNKQEALVFDKKIKFSIIVPLYNTSELYLKDMCSSVLNQTYSNWELCLADGSESGYDYIEDFIKELNDDRILYQKLDRNLGISENSNKAMAMSTGEYIVLLDHDDLIHPSALYENMIAIESNRADFVYSDEIKFEKTPLDAFFPHFKPDFSPDTLRSYNYISHLSVFSRKLYKLAGGFNNHFDGSQDYDLILRLTEKASKIYHIPKILYYWRSHEQSVASSAEAKPYVVDSAKKALSAHLKRLSLIGDILDSSVPTTYHIKYKIDSPMISIIIPNKDETQTLRTCINSILQMSTYKNYEIIVVENNSFTYEIFDYYEELNNFDNIKVIEYTGDFNYPKINNFGVEAARGEYVLFLNNDVEIITPNWIEEMLMFAQRKEVGAVGAYLLYPDNTVQHAGVIIGLGGVAGHSHKYFSSQHPGYVARLTIAQNLSAVTAACLLVSKEKFEAVEGFNPQFKVAFNDIDFCMKLRKKGYLCVFTPYAKLYHHESKSRGSEDTPEKIKRFNNETELFKNCWGEELQKGDPYYNPNLTLDREDFSFK